MASLPSGYTKLDYIESSGTQYIDTGVSSFQTQRTRVILDVDWLSGLGCYFGCFKSGLGWYVEAIQPTKIRSGYLSESKSAGIATVIGRYTVEKNGVSTNVNGVKIQHASAGNSTSISICLLACGGSSEVSDIAEAARIYSCKIYSNSALIRRFVPCKNSSGEVGLYDEVNDVFYGNAGTGVFIAGPEVPISGSSGGGKHKTLIAGTSYGIKSGRTLIGGTGYDIKKGRTLIGGTGYDISFGTPVAELAEGTIIKINESGSPVEFYVAKHNYESELNGLGRTLVVRKDCYSTRPFTSQNNNHFPTADICTWLNETYIGFLDSGVQAVITATTFKAWVTGIKVTTAEKKIFLLSATELGYVYDPKQDMYAYVEGEKLDISDLLTPAKLNGEAVRQWTRSSVPGYSATYICVNNADGDFGRAQNSMSIIGVRPIFALPETMEVDNDFILIEP